MIFSGQINRPPRSSKFAAILILCQIIVIGLAQVHVGSKIGPVPVWFCVTLLMVPLAIASRSIYAVHLNLFFALNFLTAYFPHFKDYPFSQLTLLVLYAYVVLLVPALRGSVDWLRAGTMSAFIWILILALIIISGAALVAWVHFVSPDLSRYKDFIPKVPPVLVYLFGLSFCMFNAALEEITWRGVMMEALDSALGSGICSIIIQAASFGAAHFLNGFPNGYIGSAMAFAYGIMLGFIRRKSKGLLACWIAHSAADFSIFCLIYSFVQNLQGRIE
jgi:membrane protease YdiL (CAAX protease family)